MESLGSVFQTGRIGNMELRNRLTKPGEVAYSADENGYMTDTIIGYYAEMAKGGVGLVTVGACSAFKSSPLGRYFPAIFDESYIPGHKKQVEQIHKHGAKANIQIGHHGGSTARRLTQLTNFEIDLIAPSEMVFPAATTKAREMTHDDIQRIVHGYAQAAKYGKEAGYDSVEIHGSGFALVNQFRSPYFNKRTDEYGGSVENRNRFVCEVLAAVKEAIGPDMALILKINATDEFSGGLTMEDTLLQAPSLEAAGADALLVSAGIYMMDPTGGQGMFYLDRKGALVDMAAAVKGVVNIPIIAGSGLDITLANKVIGEGKADFCALLRPLIADPHAPNKAREGRRADIRRCVYCGDCQWADNAGYRESLQGRGMACSVNPLIGSEADPEFAIKPTESPKDILVIGGGIAGMEAARTLAERNHNVTLYEKESKLGGQWNVAALMKGRKEYSSLPISLRRGVEKAGVSVELNKVVTRDLVAKMSPDAVVVATGAIPAPASFPGSALENVVLAEDLLTEKRKIDAGDRIIVVGATNPAMEIAYHLLGECERLSLVLVPGMGRLLSVTTYYGLLNKLTEEGAYIYPDADVRTLHETGMWIECNSRPLFLRADTIVQAVPGKPVNSLVRDLEGLVPEIHAIGDCVEARDASKAIREGAEIGRLL